MSRSIAAGHVAVLGALRQRVARSGADDRVTRSRVRVAAFPDPDLLSDLQSLPYVRRAVHRGLHFTITLRRPFRRALTREQVEGDLAERAAFRGLAGLGPAGADAFAGAEVLLDQEDSAADA